MSVRTETGSVRGNAPGARIAAIISLAVIALMASGSVDASAAGCARPSGVKVTSKAIAAFSCVAKEYHGLIVTYHKGLADELEGCPPPPGPNAWQILDETSAANAEYTQAASYYRAMEAAWAARWAIFAPVSQRSREHECIQASAKENEGSLELEKE